MLHNDYFLGLPAWAFPGWKDRYFTDEPSRLASYAEVFNTVEGNTTFYRVPDANTVSRWRDAVSGNSFRFCFKLPRAVTHEHRPDLDELEQFVGAIDPLANSLGPLLVQFPASVGPAELPRYQSVLETLRARHRFVVEVRHQAFFDEPALLEPTLEQFDAGRVVLDSRPIYEGDRTHPDLAFNERYIDEWAQHVARFLGTGTEMYMMIHCPNNLHCPPLALDFHRALKQVEGMTRLPDLEPWPLPEQLSLV